MIEAWLPTIVSLAALGTIFFFIKSSLSTIRAETERKMSESKEQVERVSGRLREDEREYLTIKEHDLTCSGRQNEVKLHINEVMRMMREELKADFKEIWKKMNAGIWRRHFNFRIGLYYTKVSQ